VAKLVEIASMCRTFNCLPGPGGLLQQDHSLMISMAFVVEAQHEREELEQKRGARNKGT